jgi:hypothetical protein
METARDGAPLPAGGRRCWGCDHVWNPAAEAPPSIEPAPAGADSWHGELVGEETGFVVWRCEHNHPTQSAALRCAQREYDRRQFLRRQRAAEAVAV